jgi:hypothetical protein
MLQCSIHLTLSHELDLIDQLRVQVDYHPVSLLTQVFYALL